MNQVAEEIKSVLGDDSLMHIGMPRRSGRYPWGSGDNPYQGGRDFLARVKEMKANGMSERDIAGVLGLVNEKGEPSSTLLRREMTIAKDEVRIYQVQTAKRLQEKEGMGPTAIGKEMGLNESTVRSLLDSGKEARMYQSRETANYIRDMIEKKGMIDVGAGVEKELGISKEMLEVAITRLQDEGYPVYKGGIPQATNPGQQTNQRVICPPGTPHKAIYEFDKIHPLNEDQYISRDGGETFERKFTYPSSLDSKRIMVRYKEDGGVDKDGIVELRRGVDDLSLGASRYSQVRILVDGSHYIKGMAVYGDDNDFPKGVDVIFNTNKKKGTPVHDVLKEIKNDPDNPFGSLIKDADQGGQYWYTDKKTGEKKLGLINKRADEGDWSEWADALPSQFLSKQALPMVQKQLNIAKADKMAEFDDICSLTNPTIKKHLLQKFSDECDAAAVNLKAAALPGQKYHVIVPINSLKENEIYAPNYKDGTELALIRYPHAGTFEIPVLKVNNKHKPAQKLLGKDVSDAVGITAKIAEQLSGADFDGDTVMCIPTNNGKVKIAHREPLKDLDGFDPKMRYGYDKKTVDKDGTEHYYRDGREYKHMTKRGLQTQMGIISNLITDMTLDGGASDTEMAQAVKHSMVIIDSYKHHLDYKSSEIENNIAALHKKYQGKATGGAGTIVSRAKGEYSVVKRQGTPKINEKGKEWYDPSKPEGALIYKEADDAYYTYTKLNKRTGEVETKTGTRMQRSTKMAEKDPYELVSTARNPKELAYAEYATDMKALANKARMEMVHTGKIEYSASAKKTYQTEVDSLMSKLDQALLNTTRERAANRMANAEVQSKQKANPNMDNSEIKKAKQQALTKYRNSLGAKSRRERNIDITDREWEAIQAGAISENKLKDILDNTDIAKLRERATPRTSKSLSTSQINRIRSMSSTYTIQQLSDKFGVSPSTISKYLKGEN